MYSMYVHVLQAHYSSVCIIIMVYMHDLNCHNQFFLALNSNSMEMSITVSSTSHVLIPPLGPSTGPPSSLPVLSTALQVDDSMV